MSIDAKTFIDSALARGITLWSGVPCSYLKPFINGTIDHDDVRYVGAANEGDAIAIASGAWFAGGLGVAMFQNSGLGNAVNPLTSLSMILKVPLLVICTWRGEPGGEKDEPQHALMGPITPTLFDSMQIPWALFPTTEADVAAVLDRAIAHMTTTRTPFALIMQKDAVSPTPLKSSPKKAPAHLVLPAPSWPSDVRPTRKAVLTAVQQATDDDDVLIATTGFTGRELYAIEDLPRQVYMVGSMGCAVSLGLGMAIAVERGEKTGFAALSTSESLERRVGEHPHQAKRKRIIVLDGDGALLMRLGALASAGFEAPPNLVHLLLDNEVHDSTGGQHTTSHAVDLAAVAAACGTREVHRVAGVVDVVAALAAHKAQPTHTFLHIKTAPGAAQDLPRPAVTPDDVALRLRRHLESRTA